jgi:ribosomal protein L11 methyltransferase
MATTYWELVLTLPADDCAEGLTNFLWEQGALGVVEEQASGGLPCVRAFFPGTLDDRELRARLGVYVEALRGLGFAPPGPPHLAPLPDGDWGEAWRQHFHPLPVGRRLVVAPPWDRGADASRLTLVIEPGRAFGTGHHGTTAGCLEVLERIVATATPRQALDLGTGSGILAIAAVRLGVGAVLAVDEDPEAIAAAVANAERNGVADRVHCRVDDAGALEVAPVSLVLANLLSSAHRRLAPAYVRYLASGGALVLGGILEVEAHDLMQSLAGGDLEAGETHVRDGWATLVLVRR